ncbi:unnamed protein product [Parnassius mnemosyne]|uniref:RNA-directed DNA polymerase n=1 Tax=Parnassius mnemosyne TaxID=213953 RepID=A0AAV1M9T2_9NEOP
MCKSLIKPNNYIAANDDDIVQGIYDLFTIKCNNGEPMRHMVFIGETGLVCEIDSGSAVSILPFRVYENYFKNIYNLNKSKVILNCYNGSKISPVGFITVPVTYESRIEHIRLFIIQTNNKQPALLGRDFISAFNLQLCTANCNNLTINTNYDSILREKYAKLFSSELGTFNKFKIHLKLKSDAELKFFKPRPVPLALKPKVEKELNRLLDLGILEKVNHSRVATPIVPVLRSDGDIRICGDFSVTLNKVLFMDNYPLPRIEDLFAKLHGGEQFSKLDLSRAYNQLVLDDTKELTCINTHKGLFRYTRLVFGLCSAPSIFQQTMENLLAGIEGTGIFLDDILVTGPTKAVHMERLEQVLSRLQDAGLRLKSEKCELFKDSVEYLGFIIDKTGLRKSKQKVDAILKCCRPKNVSELKSVLGMINYYRCFVPNTSALLRPLHSLLKKGEKWNWSKEHDKAFELIKKELASDRVLAHYNALVPTIVTADAGPSGLGAVLAQRQPDGTERVVAYASRSLTRAECNYAQIQKEATAIIFAIKKFHHYLYGRTVPFILRTDHKPLLTIFGNKKGIPDMAANRLQRYAIFLSAYNFTLEYVRSDSNVADFLSRSVNQLQNEIDNECSDLDKTLYINFIDNSVLKPITVEDIKKETSRDNLLIKVLEFMRNGWPRKVSDPLLKPYFNCRSELALENGCILRGHKVIIPSIFREQLLNELHSSHFGVVKTKEQARARMWWPHIDRHVEEKIGSCSVCNKFRCAPPRTPLASWPYPAQVWDRLHIDIFSLYGRNFLIAVDAYSKWVECYQLTSTNSEAIITKLCEIFSRFGLVKTIVSDNATNFCSDEINNFFVSNGIQHLTIAPYHPQSNGQAENSVKTVKRGIKLIIEENGLNNQIISKKINKFLFDYRNSRHCTTGFSPAQLMLGRSLRCRLDLLSVTTESLLLSSTSAVKKNVLSQQISQCKQYGGRRTTSFAIDDKVLVKCFYNNGSKHVWKLGRIVKKVGSRMYVVKIEKSCKSLKKHIDHLIAYKGNCTLQDDVNTDISYTDNDVIDYYTPSGTARDTAKEQNVQNTLQCTHSMNDSSSSGLLPPELELGEERIVSVGPSDTVSAVGNVLTDSALPESVSVQATSNQAVTEHSRGVRSTRNKNPIYKV